MECRKAYGSTIKIRKTTSAYSFTYSAACSHVAPTAESMPTRRRFQTITPRLWYIAKSRHLHPRHAGRNRDETSDDRDASAEQHTRCPFLETRQWSSEGILCPKPQKLHPAALEQLSKPFRADEGSSSVQHQRAKRWSPRRRCSAQPPRVQPIYVVRKPPKVRIHLGGNQVEIHFFSTAIKIRNTKIAKTVDHIQNHALPNFSLPFRFRHRSLFPAAAKISRFSGLIGFPAGNAPFFSCILCAFSTIA